MIEHVSGRALIAAAACAAFACISPLVAAAASAGTPPIPPAQLVPNVAELPGFAGAKRSLYSTVSAFEWAHDVGERSEAAANKGTAELLALRFQEGVDAFFTGRREAHGRRREAISNTFVFATEGEALQVLAASEPEESKPANAGGWRSFTVPAIPGSVGSGHFVPRRRGVTANLLFATGRCFMVVGDDVHDATTWAEGSRAPIAAAIALYNRATPLCE